MLASVLCVSTSLAVWMEESESLCVSSAVFTFSDTTLLQKKQGCRTDNTSSILSRIYKYSLPLTHDACTSTGLQELIDQGHQWDKIKVTVTRFSWKQERNEKNLIKQFLQQTTEMHDGFI